MCRPKAIAFDLLGGGVFGYSLGSFRDGVFGQFSWKEKPDSGLDFPGGDGRSLVVVGQSRGFSRDALEEVIDKRIHDAHGFGGHASIRVNLLQHLQH